MASHSFYPAPDYEAPTFGMSGTLVVKVGDGKYPVGDGTWEIVSVKATLATAPSGGTVAVDVNKNGTTIYGTQANRPIFAADAVVATVGAHSVTTVTSGDVITVDVDSVTAPAATLVVTIRLRRIA